MAQLQTQFSVSALAAALTVSRSGFHAHQRRDQRPRARREAALRPLIQESFQRSRQTYGCRRIRADLQAQGQPCGLNRLNRLQRELALRPRQKRRFRPQTTNSRHPHRLVANWLAKVPAPARPGQIWQSDFTYLETKEGWLYLAFTLDACSRRCVAHYCRADMSVELTLVTLERALQNQPPPPGLLHHSDRGVQYAAHAFAEATAAAGLTRSMSRPGNPYDNALAESFVATLKAECFCGHIPPTHAAARLQVFDYIETFYNRHRLHSSLQYRSPYQFEQDFLHSLPHTKPATP